MKANYKIVANKQKMLEKEIENFEPTSTMSVLLMRYSIIQGLLQVKLNEKDENGIPNISPVDDIRKPHKFPQGFRQVPYHQPETNERNQAVYR